MSANDVLSLNLHFQEWCTKRAAGLQQGGVNPFEYYCVDQFLKRYPLSDEDTLFGMTGGSGDGGVDAIYFLVNKRLIEEDTAIEPDATIRVNLIIFQVKETAGFSETEINKLYFFTDDLLDLTTPASAFKQKYHTHLIEIMDMFKTKYPKLVGAFPEVYIDYYYISKVDEPAVHPNAQAAGSKVTAKAKGHLSSATCEFHYINAPKLWEQVQLRPPKAKTLAWTDVIETTEGYVGLVRLHDYYLFLQDDHGDLYERIFESNVRGYRQDTEVNKSIRSTLRTPPEAEFWLLNNGITILTSKVAGFKTMTIEDPQIVNGLQSSREIFAYYRALAAFDNADNRRLLVRVIKPSNTQVREDIVRATNNQNRMSPAALRATDKIHGYIETLFRQHGLYYDRRPGQHKDDARPIERIVSIVSLLQAFVAIVLGKPHEAYGAPGRYIKTDEQYLSVFGEDRYALPLYLTCIKIQRRVDEFLLSADVDRGHRPRVRFYLATYVTCAVTKKLNPTQTEILAIDEGKITDEVIGDCYKRVWKKYDDAGADNIAAKSKKIYESLSRELKKRYALNLKGVS